jgi:hypothetical protein
VLISTITTCKGILFPYTDHNQSAQKRGKRQGRGENTIGRTKTRTGGPGTTQDAQVRAKTKRKEQGGNGRNNRNNTGGRLEEKEKPQREGEKHRR